MRIMKSPLILSQNKEETEKVRNVVVTWYEKHQKDKEKEFFNYDLSKRDDRLKVFILGIFFNCVFQETKALKIFKEMENRGYITLDKLNDFEQNVKNVIKDLRRKTDEKYGILKMQNLVDSVLVAKQVFSKKDDIIGIFKEKNSPREFVVFLREALHGISVKLFWICREYRNLLGIPEEYCYVPDRHVTKFLHNIKFLAKRKPFYSLEEYFKISRAMSNYLRNDYFDLPFMRYHQTNCKDKLGCNCEIENCRWKRS